MAETEALWAEAAQAMAEQRWKDAVRHYSALSLKYPEQVDVWIEMGIAYQQQGQLSDAETAYLQALKKEAHPSIYNNMGMIYLAQERFDEAQNQFLKGLETAAEPEKETLTYNLAYVYEKGGQYPKLLGTYQTLVKDYPENPKYLYELGLLTEKLGQYDQARQHYLSLLRRFPHFSEAYLTLGQLLEKQVQFMPALKAYQQYAAQLSPIFNAGRLAMVFALQAQCLRELGHTDAAEQAYIQGLSIASTPEMQLAQAMLLPIFYPDTQTINAWRQRLKAKLASLPKLSISNPTTAPMTLPFYLIYQGQDNRLLLELLSKKFREFLPAIRLQLAPRKLRIGFISHCIRDHSVMHLYENLMVGLQNQGFEVYVYQVGPGRVDQTTTRLSKQVSELKRLDGSLESQLEQIAQDGLSVLNYLDLGSDIFSYVLAHYRLAPVQTAMTGILQTSGIRTIDYYLGAPPFFIPEIEAQMTETPIKLPVVPAAVSRPCLPKDPGTRADFGLPSKGALYFCPMMPYKLHPDFDLALRDILQQDSTGHILCLEPERPDLMQKIKMRLQANLGPCYNRLIFHPWLPRSEYLKLLCQVDIVLDTFYVGGGNTIFTVLGAEIPIITWPAPLLSARVCFLIYETGPEDMGPCTASSPEDYVQKAVRLAHDPELYQEMQRRIRQLQPVIFEHGAVIEAYAQFFKKTALKLQN